MELDMKKFSELTPKKQKLYKRCRKNMNEIIRLRRKYKDLKRNKKSLLSDLSSEDCVNNMISRPFSLLLQSQLKNVLRKITGRRWTLDEKVLAIYIKNHQPVIDY